eukprot:g879.t2
MSVGSRAIDYSKPFELGRACGMKSDGWAAKCLAGAGVGLLTVAGVRAYLTRRPIGTSWQLLTMAISTTKLSLVIGNPSFCGRVVTRGMLRCASTCLGRRAKCEMCPKNRQNFRNLWR